MSELHKVCVESDRKRLYATPTGVAVSCCLQHQEAYDPDDGQEAGWWGWCGPMEDQSDYVLGPYASPSEVFEAYERRNKTYVRCKKVTLHAGGTGMAPTFIRHPKEKKVLPKAQSELSVKRAQKRWREVWARIDENNARYRNEQSRR